MKKIHLICGAHIDPIWQWDRTEGIAAALSTFRSAVNLAEEFDYIFCHNESFLYKYIEEYTPELFEKIQRLAAEGRWHIMGGWYIQPDCNLTSGESLIRQIQTGQKYFEEKFGVRPSTAVNFDSFGHSAGIPQVLKKCGQDSYILCRPGSDEYADEALMWESPDGSRVKVWVASGGYGNLPGKAVEKIEANAQKIKSETACILWGVGNHGGGPSRKDLTDIGVLMKSGKYDLEHSTPERFFADINPEAIHKKAFRTVMPGCYTSISDIKKYHDLLENELYLTEKICSAASIRGLMDYPEKELSETANDLMIGQFHDVLPGSCTERGKENACRIMSHGLTILEELKARAFFALTSLEKASEEGEYPILVYNPHPYEWETEAECEFVLAEQNWSEEYVSEIRMYDADGNPVPYQLIKEESHINLDWRKKIVFRAKLAPFSVTRFSVYIDYVPVKKQKNSTPVGDIVCENKNRRIVIDQQSGLLSSFMVDGKEYLGGYAFQPYLFDDNEDPWGMSKKQLIQMGENEVPMLFSDGKGVFEGMKKFRIIEDGPVCLTAEAFFSYKDNNVRIEYNIPKNENYVDIKVDTSIVSPNKMLKLVTDTAFKDGVYSGQGVYCTEPLYTDGRECVSQHFSVLSDNDNRPLAFISKSTHGSSFKNGRHSLSVLRTAAYCAHPILNRQLIPDDRYIKRMDTELKTFEFRLTPCDTENIERLTAEFMSRPYAMNLFPVPLNNRAGVKAFHISLSNRNITVSTMKKKDGEDDTYILRLFNNDSKMHATTVELNGAEIMLEFGKYEFKTVLYKNGSLIEVLYAEI